MKQIKFFSNFVIALGKGYYAPMLIKPSLDNGRNIIHDYTFIVNLRFCNIIEIINHETN